MAGNNIVVLIIDDNTSVLETMGAALEISGFTVITAADGTTGAARIAADKPNIVLLDIHLPDKDGFQVCKDAKNDPSTKDIPIILITGDKTVDIDRGFSLGADDCIMKPIDMDYLIARIKKLVNLRSKILIMDDDRQICEMLVKFLEKQGYAVVAINDGINLTAIAEAEQPALILLDISIPVGPDGIEVCRLLKNDPSTRRIPIIMLTANEYMSMVEKCFEYGAEDYLFKPFTLPDLLQHVKKYVK